MYGYGFCNLVPRYQYIYTEMNRISHKQHGLNHNDLQKMNDFVGWSDFPNANVSRKRILVFDKMFNAFRVANDIFSDNVVEEIRKRYFATEKPKVEEGSIVVHIRRGDVGPSGYGSSGKCRHLSNKWYLDYIKKIMLLYNDEKIIIHTNDDESIVDFFDNNLSTNEFDALDFKIKNHLISKRKCYKELQYTFHEMVQAKVLFMGKSSLSYMAGIINPNTVYFLNGPTDFQTSIPLKRWRYLEDFDTNVPPEWTAWSLLQNKSASAKKCLGIYEYSIAMKFCKENNLNLIDAIEEENNKKSQ